MSPILLGVIPFAMISGVAAVGIGIPAVLALAMSFIVFAGSAQLAAVQLIGVGSAVFVVILTALIVNLRFMMYSASIAPHFKPLSTTWKWLLAYLLTDQAYAVAITHFNQQDTDTTNKHWYFFGAALVFWITWQTSTAVGVFLGAQVPTSWSLDFTIPLTFMVLVFPAIKDRAAAAAAVCAGVVAVMVAAMPFNLGLITAALSGILVGLLVERRHK